MEGDITVEAQKFLADHKLDQKQLNWVLVSEQSQVTLVSFPLTVCQKQL